METYFCMIFQNHQEKCKNHQKWHDLKSMCKA
uniref:Uncharacterized protein n=1 Tax=Siphoviridae sp. ct0Bp21 TaxID=2825291 RepID=A0A8S5V2S4_9CAUD|nr:MAG TPA: hypothetical protein [Siphoviridae sp. ct0Bp21]